MNRPSIGIYIHVPFCKSKCAYCDFYSFAPSSSALDEYTERIIEDIKKWAARLERAADTLYFGGGTPSLLKGERIARIVLAAKAAFGLEDAEITVECNPAENLAEDFRIMAQAGVNRISIGAQSAVDSELKLLSRRHTSSQIDETVYAAKQAGIDNISLDIMLGIPQQTKESLLETIDHFSSLPITHISAYILKVEDGTPMAGMTDFLPDEDETAELYLLACSELRRRKFYKYEISNFCRNDMSRHNLKYWLGDEYLGLGPAAHSFIGGKRFYFPRDYEAYIKGTDPCPDSSGGDAAETLMLGLRVDKGIDPHIFCSEHNLGCIAKFKEELDWQKMMGLMKSENGYYSFTDKGALVSNECIVRLIGIIEEKSEG